MAEHGFASGGIVLYNSSCINKLKSSVFFKAPPPHQTPEAYLHIDGTAIKGLLSQNHYLIWFMPY